MDFLGQTWVMVLMGLAFLLIPVVVIGLVLYAIRNGSRTGSGRDRPAR
ncbi:MAG: hypothetical protein K2X82_15565 [Gemmataceae bacterium]|nr:hypothetical protein [Gemmataceae bacterium]